MAAPYQSSVVSRQSSEKRELRRWGLAARAGCAPGLVEAVRAGLLRVELPAGAAVAGVWPLPGEIDLRPVLMALHLRGHPILLPETPPLGNPLIFRRWWPGAPMLPERFGTQRPDTERATPDILLVPLLAFDASRHRLGYGGGYYDRTLAALPGRRAVGFGYAAQRVDRLPLEPHDRALDAVITERGEF